MYHLHALVKPHMEATSSDICDARGRRSGNPASPDSPGWARSLVARLLVLAGARVYGSAPAVIGDRVVLLETPQDDDLPMAA